MPDASKLDGVTFTGYEDGKAVSELTSGSFALIVSH